MTPSASVRNRDQLNCFLCVCVVRDFAPYFSSLIYIVEITRINGLNKDLFYFQLSWRRPFLYIFKDLFQSSYIRKSRTFYRHTLDKNSASTSEPYETYVV